MNEPRDSGVSMDDFFTRCKLPPTTRDECDAFVESKYSEKICPAPLQGYCSYTAFVGEDTIIQFRPAEYSLDMEIVSAACEIFGSLAPETEYLGNLGDTGLHIYSMKRLWGTSLSELRNSIFDFSDLKMKRQRLVRDFARLQALSWRHAKAREKVEPKGTVGSSLRWRLNLMSAGMSPRFRKFADSLLQQLQKIENLPWTLIHGDFIPANILIDPDTGEMMGLLDWAEAEYLPFGISFYGLEELLGEVVEGRFRYYPEAIRLRRLFWNELLSMIPELKRKPDVLRTVKNAQILGILFWHGIAFNEGRLDRVVEEGCEDEEIQRLDAFLLGSLGPWAQYTHDDLSWVESSLAFFRRSCCGRIQDSV